MLLDGGELVGEPAGLVVLLVGLAKTDGGFLLLDAVEHLHILTLDFLYLLLAVGVVERAHVVEGARVMLRAPPSAWRFLAAVVLRNLLEK